MPTTVFAAEHEALRASARRFAVERVGPVADAGASEAQVQTVLQDAGRLGFLSLALPEQAGGAGDLLAALVVAEEVGRAGSGGVAAAVIAAQTALPLLAASAGAGDETAAGLLTGAAAGQRRVALVALDDGVAHGVPGACGADILLVLHDDEARLVDPRTATVEPAGEAPGLGAAGMATVRLDAVGTSLRPPQHGWPTAVDAALDVEGLLLAAAAVADAAARWQDARDYALQREAFGRPVGRFQAVRHLLAEAQTLVVAARQLVHDAAWARTAERPDAGLRTASARRFADGAAAQVTDAALQVHGGSGYSMELSVQRSWRDARTSWRGVRPWADPALTDRVAAGITT